MTKIDIFSGFLGAGKTTLIKKLIAEAYAGQKLVLVENEFGEIGIDGGFLKEAGVQITEMNSGCICCSLVGDFREALKKVIDEYTPDRILIEPSGVGKLSDVTKAVQAIAQEREVSLNSFITVADVNKVRLYMKNFGEFYNDQIGHANTIILSRTGSTSEEKVARAVAMIREKNPEATIITTDWEQLTMSTAKAGAVVITTSMSTTMSTARAAAVAITTSMSIIMSTARVVAADTITSMNIIMSTAKAAAVVVDMTTGIIMRTKFLPVGAVKLHVPLQKPRFARLWMHWTAENTAWFCVQKAFCPVKKTGFTLTMFPVKAMCAPVLPM